MSTEKERMEYDATQFRKEPWPETEQLRIDHSRTPNTEYTVGPAGELKIKTHQTRMQSFVEILVNYLIGFSLAWLIQYHVLHWLGYPVRKSETTNLTLLFTAVSVIRSYAIRRFFNWLHRPR